VKLLDVTFDPFGIDVRVFVIFVLAGAQARIEMICIEIDKINLVACLFQPLDHGIAHGGGETFGPRVAVNDEHPHMSLLFPPVPQPWL
jgi:hypothetical protein